VAVGAIAPKILIRKKMFFLSNIFLKVSNLGLEIPILEELGEKLKL